MHTITNSVTRLNIYNLVDDNLLLNFKNEKKNRSTNKGNNNIFFRKELIIIYINFQLDISNLAISINLSLN